MQRTKFIKPYLEKTGKNGKCTLKATGKGVYIIKENNKVVYIGYSGYDVKQTLYRHFQKWNDKRHPETKRVQRIERVTYYNKNFDNDNYLIKVVFCKTAKEAEQLESALIKKFRPRDNSVKLDLMDLMDYSKTIEKYNEAEEIKKEDYINLPF